ncbi:MAG: hypothetical protein A3D10_00910 [Omnitrophica WOR_2 bacterium RIFCSPHIGHO2_02_FULL_48_11]|nr:MAG: hypothetical protein A3D10_00910 [Omnitrophica WOR_2 bacterium RIFCSPHIGHO2_02_FULL_48_11]
MINLFKILQFSILLVSWVIAVPTVYGEESAPPLSPETKAIANQVMLNIYDTLLKAKEKYPELEQFNEKAMYENKQGIYAIVYKRSQSEEKMKKEPYEFGVTIAPMEDTIFYDQGRYAFNFALPFLGIKFAGYEKMTYGKRQYDILKAVNIHGVLLSEHQQKFLPLQMTLKPAKTSYKVKEVIEFDVELKNISAHHMYIHEINENSLYCQFNNKVWGMQRRGASGTKDVVIKSQESVHRTFLGEGLKAPGQIDLSCTYNMSIKGVKPFAKLSVKVVNE